MIKIDFDTKDLKKKHDKIIVRRFKDMADHYKNPNGIKGNPIIYNVYIVEFDVFEAGLTVINPGNINGEYYMTKGHKHEHPTKEVYILMEGKGKLLIKKGKKSYVVTMEKGKTYILPKNWGHRIINTGNKELEVMTIYSKKAGRGYRFKFIRRFFKK
tara:strand:- start:37 stop:507 length:471 start_codon:yes stop_codon:yes gene_type:complete